jgi:hypothetical protein
MKTYSIAKRISYGLGIAAFIIWQMLFRNLPVTTKYSGLVFISMLVFYLIAFTLYSVEREKTNQVKEGVRDMLKLRLIIASCITIGIAIIASALYIGYRDSSAFGQASDYAWQAGIAALFLLAFSITYWYTKKSAVQLEKAVAVVLLIVSVYSFGYYAVSALVA